MVRGHAKAVAQEKKAAKDAERAKASKRDGNEVRCSINTIVYYIICCVFQM